VRPVVVLLVAGLALAACGEAPKNGPEPRVRLKLELPDDGGSVRAEKVEVRGTVVPADSAVQVAGEDADVDGGQFVAQVTLRPGGNVIDVAATSPGRRPATDAVRVLRDMRVELPRLVGQDLDAAADALGALRLELDEQRDESWLDRLIPGPTVVCEMDPPAGTLVDPRSRVTLRTAREC
jgi:hypothetical protein